MEQRTFNRLLACFDHACLLCDGGNNIPLLDGLIKGLICLTCASTSAT
jgi:hypothetical protein